MKLKIFGLIIIALAMASCNALENQSTSATMLKIVSLTGNDMLGKPGSTTVFSDVITNGSIFNDNGLADVKAAPLDPLIDATLLTPYMEVQVDQIDVAFKRTDGRNIEGVDVPYHFNQPMSVLVTFAASSKIPFVIINHVAKIEAPLFELTFPENHEKVLELVAIVTIYGKDLGGHRVKPVTGYVTVWCSNFADPEADPEE